MATVNVVSDFGAAGNGTTDDTAAIQAAIDTKNRVYLPRGRYKITSTLTIANSGQLLFGDGVGASTILIGRSTLNGVEFHTAQNSGLQDLSIGHTGTARGGYAVTFKKGPSKPVGCFQAYLDRVRLEEVYHGVRVESSTSCTLRRLMIEEPRGTRGVYFVGTGPGADGSYRLVIDDLQGESQTTKCDWIRQDNYAYSLVIDKADLSGGKRGFVMADTANTGNSYPIWVFVFNLAVDGPNFAGIHLHRGEGAYLTASSLMNCVTGNGGRIESSYRGEVSINGGTTITGNAKNGIWLQSGPVDVRFTDLMINDNSTLTDKTYAGIRVEGGCRDFQITNSAIGDKSSTQASQRYGIFIRGGCSNYIVANNNLRGNNNQGLRDLGSAPKQTSLNLE